ncbi:MAG: CBS domain-containing protein [Roseiflexus sp.]
MKDQRVADWMSAPAIVITSTVTLADAQRLMEQRRIRRLPIVENGRLVGIITRGDLRTIQPADTTLSHYEWRALLDRVTVAECMTRHVLTISPDASTLDAARLMLKHKIGGLPVVDDDGRVIGIITESDLFRLQIALATGSELHDTARPTLICHHCGAVLRGRSLETIGRDDQCWRCHYHLHRCDNCRYFNGIGCMLDRPERHTPIPGRDCKQFVYLVAQEQNAGR